MQHLKTFGLVALLVVLLSSGCSLGTPPLSVPVTITPIGTLTPSPTLFIPTTVPPSPTVYIPAPVTATPTLFVPAPVTATPTLFVPPTFPPTPEATRALPPGVYIQNMRLDPPNAKQKQDITFNVRFFNNTGREQEYRWFVYIYPEGKTAPMGQTSWDKAYKIPPGVSELASFSAWKVGGGQPCTNYVGVVHWLRADGAKPAFSDTEGREYALPFTVCP